MVTITKKNIGNIKGAKITLEFGDVRIAQLVKALHCDEKLHTDPKVCGSNPATVARICAKIIIIIIIIKIQQKLTMTTERSCHSPPPNRPSKDGPDDDWRFNQSKRRIVKFDKGCRKTKMTNSNDTQPKITYRKSCKN